MSVTLERYCGFAIEETLVELLHRHYLELSQWNERLSLVSPEAGKSGTTPGEIIERHYGESLLALELLGSSRRSTRGRPAAGQAATGQATAYEPGAGEPGLTTLPRGTLWDLGSGAGFPGLVLAAACPALDVTLIESRQRKWSFLSSAVRKMGLRTSCVNARVGRALRSVDRPDGADSSLAPQVDWIASRAVSLTEEIWTGLEPFLGLSTRLLLWVAREAPGLPHGFTETGRVAIPGADHRAVVRYQRTQVP